MPENKRDSRTDWAKVDATSDDDIARQIAEDPDTAPELNNEWFDRAEVWDGNRYLGRGKDVRAGRIGRPKGSGKKEMVTLRLDREILDHFRAGGPGWQTRLNDTLLAATLTESRITRKGSARAARPAQKPQKGISSLS